MKRILVIRGGAVGDFVLSLPLLDAVRKAYDGARIHVLGYRHIAELARGRRLSDDVDRVDALEWAPLFGRGGALGNEARAWLRAFDFVICIWPDGDGTIRENLIRAGCGDVLSVNPLPEPGSGIHAIDFMARQCEGRGLGFTGRAPRVFPSERDTWWAERFMRVTGAGERPLLGIHPGSGSPRKNWPLDRCLAVAREWVRERGGNILLVSGPAEEDRFDALSPLAGMERAVAIRSEKLPRLAAVLARCEAFLGNDSGISHLAAAAGTPTVAVFGPTDPIVWGPRGKRVAVLGGGGDTARVEVADVIGALNGLLAQ